MAGAVVWWGEMGSMAAALVVEEEAVMLVAPHTTVAEVVMRQRERLPTE
jgi:hypothetical protein